MVDQRVIEVVQKDGRIDIMARIEGGQWGLSHLRIGITEKLITFEISKDIQYKAIF